MHNSKDKDIWLNNSWNSKFLDKNNKKNSVINFFT